MLQAYTDVPRIRVIFMKTEIILSHHHFLVMKMSVDICTEPTKRFRVNRDVTQDYLVAILILLDHVSPDVVEVFQVIIDLEDVMITLDKNETTVQAAHGMNVTPVHGKITKDIHPIVGVNYGVMISDNSFIVFFNRAEGP